MFVHFGASVSEPNCEFFFLSKATVEDITGEQWNMEQVPVPQQDEGGSCGYRVLSNLNEVIKGQGIQGGGEERNRLYYYWGGLNYSITENSITRRRPEG